MKTTPKLTAKNPHRHPSRRAVVAGVGASLLPMSIGLRAHAQETELRMAWWGSDTRHNATLDALEAFKKAEPGIAISAEYGGYSNYFEKLSTQLAARSAPDLVQMSVDGFPSLASKGALMDLNTLVDKGLLDLSSFDAGVLEQGQQDGKQVTLPIGLTAPIILTDQSVLDKLGLSYAATSGWDGYAELATEVASGTPDGYWGTADGGGYRGFLETWIRQDGATFFDVDGQLGFTKGQLADFFAYWERLRSANVAVPAGEQAIFQENLDGLPIVRGIAALDTSFVTIFGGLQNMVTNTLGHGPMPYEDASNSGQSPTFGLSFSIISGSKNQDEAAKLLQFLTHDPKAVQALGFTRGVTPSSTYNEIASQGMSDDDLERSGVTYIESLREFSAGATPPPPPRGGEVQQRLLRRINEEIAFERSSIQEGVDAFFAEATAILRRR